MTNPGQTSRRPGLMAPGGPRPVIGLTCNYFPPEEPGCPSRFGSYYLNTTYHEAVVLAGGLPVVLPFNPDPSSADALLARVDGLILTGGKDMDASLFGEANHPACERVIPAKSRFEDALVRSALARDLPLLGICLGLQALNVACGGSLVQDLPSQRPALGHPRQTEAERLADAHPVSIAPGSLLARVTGATTLRVNSVHHQAVDRIGDGLAVTATSPDGLVEALESPRHRFVLTVQWHPEDLFDRPAQRALFEALVRSARGEGAVQP